MSKDNTQTTVTTVQKTLWSDTLFELLIIALQNNRSDGKIIDLLKDLKQKKFKASYIRNKIKKSLGEKEAERIKSLISKMSPQASTPD